MIFLKNKKANKDCMEGWVPTSLHSLSEKTFSLQPAYFVTLLSLQYFKNRDITSCPAPIILKQKINGFGEQEALSNLSVSILLLQVDIPNIQKQRKHLAKLVLDMDSARTR